MLQTEFVRNLNCNYERILLDVNPENKRYQYCILSRGGIKGLLTSSLRYINGQAYLYYDISSKQNVVQLYSTKPLTRKWLKDFLWSFRRIREELSRFLLDEQHILWFPQEIFRDLESGAFFFLYVPYYEEDNGFKKLLEFMVEHIDYDDEELVECVYHMYEQFENSGWDYLQQGIFKDAEVLDKIEEEKLNTEQPVQRADYIYESGNAAAVSGDMDSSVDKEEKEYRQVDSNVVEEKSEKKGLMTVLRGKRRKDKEQRESYQNMLQSQLNGYAVAEETPYGEEEWGRTVFMELPQEIVENHHGLYTPDGKLLAKVEKSSVTIGKKKEEVDVVLEDISVSRMHARILKEGEKVYLEDLNSTNGTFKNGLRMEPYERRELEAGDEIRIGARDLVYR